jgi:replicative DNA helicase
LNDLPHDLGAEEALIGSLIIDGSAIDKVRYSLKPEHFYYAPNQLQYKACLALAERRVALDQITIAQELARQGNLEKCGGAANLSRLISICPTALDIEHYAEIVQRLATMREVIGVGERIRDIGYSDAEDANQAIEDAVTTMRECQRKHTRVDKLITPEQLANGLIDMVGEYNEGRPGLTWGFNCLDAMTTGMQPGELGIVAARPSVGKSQVLGDCAENIVERYPDKIILVASVEMSVRMVLERKASRVLGIPVRVLRIKGWQDTQDGQLMKYAGKVSKQGIYYLPPGSTSVEIAASARQLKANLGLDVIFVDYLQRLPDSYPQHKNETRDQSVGRACSNLKQLAVDLNVPVIVASQLNRAVEHREDKAPGLSDLRDSGNIEQDADAVLLLHRNVANREARLQVIQAKGRQVGTGVAELWWDDNTQRYREGK